MRPAPVRYSRTTWWPWLAGLAAACGLLLALQQVVSRAVRLGDLRRHAAALHDLSVWQCKALRERSARDTCLVRAATETNPEALAGS